MVAWFNMRKRHIEDQAFFFTRCSAIVSIVLARTFVQGRAEHNQVKRGKGERLVVMRGAWWQYLTPDVIGSWHLVKEEPEMPGVASTENTLKVLVGQAAMSCTARALSK